MKVVRLSASHTGRLYPRKYSWYTFSLWAESTPEPWYGREEYVTEKSRSIIGQACTRFVRNIGEASFLKKIMSGYCNCPYSPQVQRMAAEIHLSVGDPTVHMQAGRRSALGR
jgi:hypothetical protein